MIRPGRRAAKRLLPFAALVLSLFLWAGASASAGMLRPFGSTSLLLDGSPVSFDDVMRMREIEETLEEPFAFTAWRQFDNQTVKNKAFGRTTRADVVLLQGSSQLVLPLGARLDSKDLYGCLIDEETSYSLFGDRTAVGGEITLEDRTYVVRGVFSAPRPAVLVQAVREMESASFNRMSLGIPDSPLSSSAAQGFLNRHGLSRSFLLDQGAYAGWGAAFSRIPALLLLLWAAAGIGKKAMRLRASPMIAALLLLAAIAAALSLLWAAGMEPSVPQSLVPTRWSDFEFWQRLIEGWKTSLTEFLWMKKDALEVYAVTLLAKTALPGLLAGGLTVYWLGRVKIHTARRALFLSFLSASACFLAIVMASRTGSPDLRMLWFSIPLYCLFRFAEQALLGYLKPNAPTAPAELPEAAETAAKL